MNYKFSGLFATLLVISLSSIAQFIQENSEFASTWNKGQKAYNIENYRLAKFYFNYCKTFRNHDKASEATKMVDRCMNILEYKQISESHVRRGNLERAKGALESIARINPRDESVKSQIAQIIKEIESENIPTFPPGKEPGPLTVLPNPPPKPVPQPPKLSPFESTYANGINALSSCNYGEALKHFTTAHKMRPGAAKTKKYFLDLQAIINLEKQVADLKRSTNSNTADILSLYDRIAKLNAGFELTQSGSACTKTEPDACAYVWDELPEEATKFNCSQILSFAERLKNCTSTPENQNLLTVLRSDCENLNNECIIANRIIDTKIKEAQRLQNQNFYEASNSSFDAVTTEIQKLKTACKDFIAIDFEKTIAESRRLNDKNIFDKTCRDKQQKTFELALNETDSLISNYKKALDLLASIDTTCLENQFKAKLTFETNRINKIYRKRTMADLERAAARFKSQYEYNLEEKPLKEALTLADLETDKKRIQTKLTINKCYRETGKNCEEARPPILCSDTITIKQTGIQVLIGATLSSLNATISPVIRFQSTIATGNYKPTPFIGLRLNHQSFEKKIDFNTSLVYIPPHELTFLNDNGSTFSNLKYNNFDLDFNLKFHRLRDCSDKGRAYLFAGGNAGYKKLISSTNPVQATSDYVSENYSKVLLGGFQTGIGYEFPKDKLNFEIEFKRQAMFSNGVNNLEESNSIFNSPFSLGYAGIKLGYTLKNWTSPKK